MSTLVIVEHNNQTIHAATYPTVSAALELNQEVTLFVAGSHCSAVVEEASRIKGVNKVIYVDEVCYTYQLPENLSEVIYSLSKPFSAIVAPASTFGKNLLPRIAALLDVAQVSDVSKIVDENTFEHPIYAGNAIETVKVLDAKKVLTIRVSSFDKVNETQASCEIEKIDKEIKTETLFLDQQVSHSERPDLLNADIVISGGRALQSAEGFKLIEQLADTLGGAVGASRAAVDAGFVPNDYQVGQTGKIVAPSLYIAVGISGAVQHLAGMKDSKVIVAINKDENAPIFQIATYGLIGDLFEIVPELISQLKH